MKKGDRIYFEWVDASSSGGEWKSQKETDTFFSEAFDRVEQVGFFYKKNKDYLFTYSQIIHDKNDTLYGHLSKVPKAWIKEIKVL